MEGRQEKEWLKNNPDYQEAFDRGVRALSDLAWIKKVRGHEPIEDIIDDVLQFKDPKNQQLIKSNDLPTNLSVKTYPTVASLRRMLQNIDEVTGAEDPQYDSLMKNPSHVEFLGKVGRWELLMPISRAGSVACDISGKDTTWCTTKTRGQNLFYSYVARDKENIILFYVMDYSIKDTERYPKSRMSVGFVNGSPELRGQDGGLSVDADNKGLTDHDLRIALGDSYGKIMSILAAKAQQIGGEHPAKETMTKAAQNVLLLKKLTKDYQPAEKVDFFDEVLKRNNYTEPVMKYIFQTILKPLKDVPYGYLDKRNAIAYKIIFSGKATAEMLMAFPKMQNINVDLWQEILQSDQLLESTGFIQKGGFEAYAKVGIKKDQEKRRSSRSREDTSLIYPILRSSHTPVNVLKMLIDYFSYTDNASEHFYSYDNIIRAIMSSQNPNITSEMYTEWIEKYYLQDPPDDENWQLVDPEERLRNGKYLVWSLIDNQVPPKTNDAIIKILKHGPHDRRRSVINYILDADNTPPEINKVILEMPDFSFLASTEEVAKALYRMPPEYLLKKFRSIDSTVRRRDEKHLDWKEIDDNINLRLQLINHMLHQLRFGSDNTTTMDAAKVITKDVVVEFEDWFQDLLAKRRRYRDRKIPNGLVLSRIVLNLPRIFTKAHEKLESLKPRDIAESTKKNKKTYSKNYLRKIIYEELNSLINEEIYGGLSILYHGSKTEPQQMLDIIENDKFDPGGGAGDMYGKGLYTVYTQDFETNSNTFGGYYGPYVYKLMQNLNGFICFDPEPCRKLYGKVIPVYDQLIATGKNDIANKLEKMTEYSRENYVDSDLDKIGATLKAPLEQMRERLTSRTAPMAKIYSKHLKSVVPGIIFTGANDGHVAVIYGTQGAVPVGWRMSTDKPNAWRKWDRESIKLSLRRSATGTYTSKSNIPESQWKLELAALKDAANNYLEGKDTILRLDGMMKKYADNHSVSQYISEDVLNALLHPRSPTTPYILEKIYNSNSFNNPLSQESMASILKHRNTPTAILEDMADTYVFGDFHPDLADDVFGDILDEEDFNSQKWYTASLIARNAPSSLMSRLYDYFKKMKAESAPDSDEMHDANRALRSIAMNPNLPEDMREEFFKDPANAKSKQRFEKRRQQMADQAQKMGDKRYQASFRFNKGWLET